MNTISETIQNYLETPKGQRVRKYNEVLHTYLSLLESNVLVDELNSILGRKVQDYINQININPHTQKAEEMRQELANEVEGYINSHFTILKSLG